MATIKASLQTLLCLLGLQECEMHKASKDLKKGM
jgi:hypothetical protein